MNSTMVYPIAGSSGTVLRFRRNPPGGISGRGKNNVKERQNGWNGGRERWEWIVTPFPPFPPLFFKPLYYRTTRSRSCTQPKLFTRKLYVSSFWMFQFSSIPTASTYSNATPVFLFTRAFWRYSVRRCSTSSSKVMPCRPVWYLLRVILLTKVLGKKTQKHNTTHGAPLNPSTCLVRQKKGRKGKT